MPMIGPGRRVARRRVVGAAVVGGAAYHAGKKGAEAGAEAPRSRCPRSASRRAAGAGGGALLAELQELAKLHEQGIIDDEEFAAKKEQILGIQ